MRVSSRSSSNRLPIVILLAAAGTVAGLIAIATAITGGFALLAGPLRLSSHRWRDGLVVAAAAWLGAALVDRRQLTKAGEAIATLVETRASTLAVLVAASALGVGMAYSTYSASGADAAGYVSEATALASGSLVHDEPLARELSWPEATWAFSPLGYRPGPAPGEIVPTYPAGLPLVMALASTLAPPHLRALAPYLVVPLLGACAIFWTFVLGTRLHSRLAGLIAATLLATSPIFLFQLVQPMSDVPVTAWWTLALVFAAGPASAGALAAGVASGLAILTRPNLAPLLLAVGYVIAQRRTRRALLPFAVGVLPAIGALLLLQWRLYGTPFTSGYGAVEELFAWSAIWPNTLAYSARLLQSERPMLALAVIGALALAVSRRFAPVAPAATVAATMTVLVLAAYLPYGVFAEWFYLRFLLPAFALALIVAGAAAGEALALVPLRLRGLLVLTTLTLICSLNLVAAAQQQTFRMRDYESRYRTVGNYLESALPANAVVVTSQESASVFHYAQVPIVRWDLIDGDLDTAIADVRARHRYPVILAEDWEMPFLGSRFPRSQAARVDWRPRAFFLGTTRVVLFDPADRAVSGAWTIDVLR